VKASNIQKARSPAASHSPTTIAAARCASSMDKCPSLVGDIAGPCDAPAPWCTIEWELAAADPLAAPAAAPCMVVEAMTAPPNNCNAACNSPCPPASNATDRAGLLAPSTNGATANTMSRNNGTSTEAEGVSPPANAWPASPLVNSTDGSVSTRIPRGTESDVITRPPKRQPI
jgi:hypothetical protein